MQGTQPGEIFLSTEQILDAGRVTNPQQVAALLLKHFALEAHFARSGLHQARQYTQQAGFAAAIGATDLQHVATGKMQVEMFEQHPPVTLTRERYGV